MELKINKKWNFKKIVENIEALKETYKGILASFSYIELHEKVEFMRKTRDAIYSLKFEEQKKDRLWNYFNDFEYLSVLKSIADREK